MEIKIVIDDRIVDLGKKLASRRTLAIMALLSVAVPVVLYANNLNVFQGGEPISASAVNENFGVLGEHMAVYEDAITVDGVGNVGIGTTEPKAGLHLKGAFLVNDSHSVSDNPSTDGFAARVHTRDSAGGLKVSVINGIASNISGLFSTEQPNANGYNAALWAKAANSAGPAYGLIVESGNVGIGTTSPAYKLDVAGQIRADNVAVSSDIRLKADIAPLEHALDGIECLNAVTYRWADPDRPQDLQIGFIAQEVERCFPEVVTTDEQGYKSVAYARLVAPLAAAVKAQQGMIDQQRKTIREQQHTIDSLGARLSRLEASIRTRIQ